MGRRFVTALALAASGQLHSLHHRVRYDVVVPPCSCSNLRPSFPPSRPHSSNTLSYSRAPPPCTSTWAAHSPLFCRQGPACRQRPARCCQGPRTSRQRNAAQVLQMSRTMVAAVVTHHKVIQQFVLPDIGITFVFNLCNYAISSSRERCCHCLLPSPIAC